VTHPEQLLDIRENAKNLRGRGIDIEVAIQLKSQELMLPKPCVLIIFSYFFIHYNLYNNSLRNFKMTIPLLFRVINTLLIVIVILAIEYFNLGPLLPGF
jgi:hypothetical protein